MRQPRLLVADDQPDVIEALRLLLKGEGYEIETASSPRAVVEIVQARELDLVLMDLNYARHTTSGSLSGGSPVVLRMRSRREAMSDVGRRRYEEFLGAPEETANQRKLLYVALTRAKRAALLIRVK